MNTRYYLLCFFLILFQIECISQTNTVFKSGKEGHKTYRIPAIISLPNGKLLAFAEGRVNNSGDFGDINIVMKSSTDKGKHWSSLEMIVNYDSLQAGNPAPVVDLLDPLFPNGVIYLFYNTGNNRENLIRKGKGVREVWLIRSIDGGTSWSSPENITIQVHKPHQPQFNSTYHFSDDWRSYANTPGHAFQFQHGVYKGRIYIAANHSAGNPHDDFSDYAAHGYFSDDHGKTFKLSSSIPIPGSNESMGTELSNNKMMMTVRNQRGDIKSRILAYSTDGGSNWDTVYFDPNLPDPICQGSILTIGYVRKNAIIATCNAADTTHRDNLTLRISYDEGKSWKYNIVVDKSTIRSKKLDWAAYSDLVVLDKKTIGVLYERNDYDEIVFKPLNGKNSLTIFILK